MTASFPVEAEDVGPWKMASGVRDSSGNPKQVVLDLGGDRSLAGDEVPTAEGAPLNSDSIRISSKSPHLVRAFHLMHAYAGALPCCQGGILL